ncbi:MAG: hypothetical protein JRN68_00690 [Nitrososphaerota archaeon]|jgi:hypothetical protein|nr:hypothetical protein [Nitrososphaerota archaeon]
MGDDGEEVESERRVRYFRLSILKIQNAIAKAPGSQRLVARTTDGVATLEKPAVSKLIDLAYVERKQVITDKLILEETEGRIVVKHKSGDLRQSQSDFTV